MKILKLFRESVQDRISLDVNNTVVYVFLGRKQYKTFVEECGAIERLDGAYVMEVNVDDFYLCTTSNVEPV